ncbi:MAG: hypothetical protein ABR915_22230, partial [Thermoguttaceae bacterium]
QFFTTHLDAIDRFLTLGYNHAAVEDCRQTTARQKDLSISLIGDGSTAPANAKWISPRTPRRC